jgi:hypothetical protein
MSTINLNESGGISCTPYVQLCYHDFISWNMQWYVKGYISMNRFHSLVCENGVPCKDEVGVTWERLPFSFCNRSGPLIRIRMDNGVSSIWIPMPVLACWERRMGDQIIWILGADCDQCMSDNKIGGCCVRINCLLFAIKTLSHPYNGTIFSRTPTHTHVHTIPQEER